MNPVTSTVFSLSYDTWYLFELESSGTDLTATVKDATGTTTLGSVSLTDDPRTYTTGRLGFYNFTVNASYDPLGYPVYFDDFALEVIM